MSSSPHWILNYAVRVCLAGADTDGALSIAEYLKPPGDWTPLHLHRRESQTTYVLEGEVTVHLPSERHVLHTGACLFQPAGVPHTETVTSDSPARILDVYAPAGFERWVSLAGRPTENLSLPPAAETLDERRMGELLEITAELGVEVLGAPGQLP